MSIATSNIIQYVNLQLREIQPHSKSAQNKEKAKLNLRSRTQLNQPWPKQFMALNRGHHSTPSFLIIKEK